MCFNQGQVMGDKVASCLIMLHLFLVMFAEALAEVGEKSKQIEMNSLMEENGVIRMVTKMAGNFEEVNSMADQQQHHMEHTNDPSHMIKFSINDLKTGKKVPLYLPPKDPSTSPPILTKERADSIPFSLKQLPQILKFFSFSPGSPQAQAVENTLHQCEIKPNKGETKLCATSMESMADSARLAFGLDSKSSVKHLAATTYFTKPRPPYLQNYTLLQIPNEFIIVPEFLACHAITYPYAVHWCHSRQGDSKVMQILLEGDNGNRALATTICHMNKPDMSPDHMSFRVHKSKSEMIPVCHVLPPNDLIWIPMST